MEAREPRSGDIYLLKCHRYAVRMKNRGRISTKMSSLRDSKMAAYANRAFVHPTLSGLFPPFVSSPGLHPGLFKFNPFRIIDMAKFLPKINLKPLPKIDSGRSINFQILLRYFLVTVCIGHFYYAVLSQ